jgi:hypothetical protein
MTTAATHYVIWVAPAEADDLTDAEILARLGLDDHGLEVRRERLSGWMAAEIPADARDEWGHLMPGKVIVYVGQLPPEGRIFIVPCD